MKGREYPTTSIAFKCNFRDIDELFDYELDRQPRFSPTVTNYITDIVFYLKDEDYKIIVKDYYEENKSLIETLKSVKYSFYRDYEGVEFIAEPYEFVKSYKDYEVKRAILCKNESMLNLFLALLSILLI